MVQVTGDPSDVLEAVWMGISDGRLFRGRRRVEEVGYNAEIVQVRFQGGRYILVNTAGGVQILGALLSYLVSLICIVSSSAPRSD